MKKILTIIGCAVLLAVSSCTKQYVSPGTTNETIYANVAPTDWALSTDNSGIQAYAVPISIHDLTSDFASYGGVIVAISYDNGATYEQLPEVYANVSYSFTYTGGNLTLYAQTGNGTTPVQPSLAMKVKIILVDSN